MVRYDQISIDQIDLHALRMAVHEGIHHYGVINQHESWDDEGVLDYLTNLREMSKVVFILARLKKQREDSARAVAGMFADVMDG